MDLQNMFETAKPALIAVGFKVVGAIVLYIVGRWLIGVAGTLIQKSLERQKVEPTVVRYIGNAIGVALNILLVIGILGYFGVETTSFAALIAALGIAIGAAWGGLLSNFAAGAFILVLRPPRSATTCSRARSKAPCGRSASSSRRSTPRTMCRLTSATRRS
jgi:small conductance mechanosensitive channel